MIKSIILSLIFSPFSAPTIAEFGECNSAPTVHILIECIDSNRSKLESMTRTLNDSVAQFLASARKEIESRQFEDVDASDVQEITMVDTNSTLLRRQRLYDNLNSDLENYADPALEIEFIRSPNVNVAVANSIADLYEDVYSKYGKFVNKVVIVQSTERDYEWYSKKVRELEGVPEDFWFSGHCTVSIRNFCAYGSGRQNYALFYQFIGTEYKPEDNLKVIAHHEAVHSYQMSVFSRSNLHPNCWISEGHANALGFATVSRVRDVTDDHKYQVQQISRVFPNFRNFTRQDWIRALDTLDGTPDCFGKGTGYSIGMLIVESLYYRHGLDKTHEFILHLANWRSFDGSLQQVFGMTRSDYLSHAADYLVEMVPIS